MIIATGPLMYNNRYFAARYETDRIINDFEKHDVTMTFCIGGLHEFFGVDDATGKRLVISDVGPGKEFVFDLDHENEGINSLDIGLTAHTFWAIVWLLDSGVINKDTTYYVRLV